MIRCIKCHEEKDDNEFYRVQRKYHETQRQPCKACIQWTNRKSLTTGTCSNPDCGKPYFSRTKTTGLCGECYHHRNDPSYSPSGVKLSQPIFLAIDPVLPGPAEDAYAKWQRAIGQAESRYVQPEPTFSNSEHVKYLLISDLHIPFHEPEMLARASQIGADKLIILGDFTDSYAVSRFIKYDHMPFREEWAQVTVILEQLASKFPEVLVVMGNHDARVEKQIRSNLDGDMVDAVLALTGGSLSPLRALVNRFPNVKAIGHQIGELYGDWIAAIGDAILVHAEKYSKVPASALRQIEEWIADNQKHLGLPDYRLIVQAHTHQMGIFPWRSDTLLVECGCLAKTQGYMIQPRIGGRPQRRGYMTFEQKEGRTDLNSVHLHCFDLE